MFWYPYLSQASWGISPIGYHWQTRSLTMWIRSSIFGTFLCLMFCEGSYTHQQKVLVVFTLRLSLLITVSLTVFICSEYEHTDLILKCLFIIVMVPILLGLLLYFIFEVYICCFSHKIHDDLLVLVQSSIVWISVFTWRHKQTTFESLSSVCAQ